MRREALLFFLDSEDIRTISIKLISDNRGRLIKIQNKYLKGCTCSGCHQGYYWYGKRNQLMKNKAKGSMDKYHIIKVLCSIG